MQVLLQRPTSLVDTVVLAERADAAFMMTRGLSMQKRVWPGSNNKFSRGRNGGPVPMDIDLLQQQQKQQNQADKQVNGDIECYFCGKHGHMKRDCYKWQK